MSTPSSAIELLELVRKSGVVHSETLDDRLRGLPHLPTDPAQSAAVLVKHGIITRFQAKILLTGRYRGFKLGSYVIREQIGQGGMGAVYLAEHETLRRRVAIKVLTPPKGDANPKLTIERFLREARAAAALDHPNIVRIHDVARQEDTHYLVMEYVEGQSLEELLNRGGTLTPSRAVDYIAQAAAGLQHAAERGFVHRDIKPANLMLAKDGTVKILDMGLARSYQDQGDKLTEIMDEGAIVGTADFISPEQAMNNPDIDIRSDIYSLGATFYALVTGKPPFSGNTTQKLVQHQMKSPPTLDQLDKTFSPELAAVVAKMMAKKPEDRYRQPADVIAALAPWLPEVGATRVMAGLSGTELSKTAELQNTLTEIAAGSTKRISPSKRLQPAETKPWVLYASVAASVVAAIGVVAWAIIGYGRSEPTPTPTEIATAPPPPKPATPPAAKAASPKPPTVATKATPPVSQAPASKQLWKFDASTFPAGKYRLDSNGIAGDAAGLRPIGLYFQSWEPGNAGELFKDTVHGELAIGLRNIKGVTAQIMLNVEDMISQGLVKNRDYELRFRYRTQGETNIALAHHQDRGSGMVYQSGEPLAPSTDQWQTFVKPFTRSEYLERFTIDNLSSSSDAIIFISSVELIEQAASGSNRSSQLATNQTPRSGDASRLNRTASTIHAVDFKSLTPVSETLPPGKTYGSTNLKGVLLPPGVKINKFRPEAEGRYRIADIGGTRAMGIECLNGEIGVQLDLQCHQAFAQQAVGETLKVVLCYRYEGSGKGKCGIEMGKQPYRKYVQQDLVPTGDEWRNVALIYTREDGHEPAQVIFHANGAAGTFWLKSLVIVRELPQEANPQLHQLYQLELGGVKPFHYIAEVRENKEMVIDKPNAHQMWPAGWDGRLWAINDKAKFGIDLHDGQPVLFAEHIAGRGSMMLFSPSIDCGHNQCDLEFEYCTLADEGYSAVRFLAQFPEPKKAVDVMKLPLTRGRWEKVRRTVDMLSDTGGRFEFHLGSCPPGSRLLVRNVRILAAQPTDKSPNTNAKRIPQSSNAPTGNEQRRLVLSYDFAQGQPFQTTVIDGKSTLPLQEYLPDGAHADCWNRESVAEFRRAEVNGQSGIGITNHNDTISSQINFYDLGSIQQNKRYALHVHYLTRNDAVGKVFVRRPDNNYESFAAKDLVATNGEWRTVVLEFTRPDATSRIDAQITNVSVGEGNTLYIGRVEIFELSK